MNIKDIMPSNYTVAHVEKLEQAISQKDEMISLLEGALEFYGDIENYRLNSNYNSQNEIMYDDEKYVGGCGCKPICQCPSYGGKLARQTIAKLNELKKEQV